MQPSINVRSFASFQAFPLACLGCVEGSRLVASLASREIPAWWALHSSTVSDNVIAARNVIVDSLAQALVREAEEAFAVAMEVEPTAAAAAVELRPDGAQAQEAVRLMRAVQRQPERAAQLCESGILSTQR